MKKLSIAVSVMLSAVAAYGATVNWSATIDTGVIDTGGAALTAGNYIRIGYFGTLSDAQVATNALTLSGISTLNSDFHEFANSTIGAGFGGNAGGFNAASAKLYSSLPGFDTSTQHQIYFWALKATNNTTLANALSTTTQTAIGFIPKANLPGWQFPSATPTDTNVTSIEISEFANVNRLFQAGTFVAAGSPSLDGIFGASNHAVQLAAVAPVPEPSVLAFLGMAAFATAAARRRKRG